MASMMNSGMVILLLALILDWKLGDPRWLWDRVPHPVKWFGQLVDIADRNLNFESDGGERQYRNGALAISGMIIVALVAGSLLSGLLSWFGIFGFFAEIAIVGVLIAQKSLKDHTHLVVEGLRNDGLAGGRAAVAHIVGRDVSKLDQTGISRAAIESLSENFSDGVVAPAFWYAVFGLPGILAYKMINTADSMIGHKSEPYQYFGRATAKIDDLANWVPARLSAGLIALGAYWVLGMDATRAAVSCAIRDSGLHPSPNAGWPEAAMAGACGIRLGGARVYGDKAMAQAQINASGRNSAGIVDIETALRVYRYTCYSIFAIILIIIVLF